MALLSLHQRVAYSRDWHLDGLQLPFSKTVSLRPSSYRTWKGSQSMAKAVEAIQQGELTLRQATELYDVPRATLHDHVTGKVKPDSVSGPGRYLTIQEEEELVNFLFGCSRIGYPRTRPQVLAIVQQYIDRRNLKKIVSNGWWQRFRERHEKITLRSAAPLCQVRAMAMDRDSIDRYFNILENTLCENGIMDKPKQIFNCDESGMPLSPKAPMTVSRKGDKNPSHITSDTKSQITVLVCVNAAGDFMPPFVIFDRKKLIQGYTKGEVPNTYYGLSPKGWIDTALFQDWFLHHFLIFAPPIRPLLLLMDGHSSHFSPEMIRLAAEEQVILFVLPPHTTQICQPLDKGVFAALKTNWKQACHNFLTKNPGRVVSRYDFSELFCEAWDESMTIKNIKSGFRITGICPFDKDVISLPEDEFEEFRPEALSHQSGLAYIPLYSPACQKRVRCRSPETSLCTPTSATGCNTSSEYSDQDSVNSVDTPANSLQYHSSRFCQLLQLPTLPSKIPTKHTKCSGRVLTSAENLLALEQKEQEKEQTKREKEERKLLREEKKRERERLKVEKQRKREAQKVEKQKPRQHLRDLSTVDEDYLGLDDTFLSLHESEDDTEAAPLLKKDKAPVRGSGLNQKKCKTGSTGSVKRGNLLMGCNISVTGASVIERDKVKKICEDNGGTYSGELTRGSSSHLLVWNTSGPKFKKAIEWRICTVRPQWLLDSVTRNECLVETDYFVHPGDSEDELSTLPDVKPNVSIPGKSKQLRATRSKTTDVPGPSGTTDTDQPVKTALPTKGRRVTKTGSSDVSIPVKCKQLRATRSKTTDVPGLSETTDADQPVKTTLPTKGGRVTKFGSNDVSIPVKCKQLRETRSKTTDVPGSSATTDTDQPVKTTLPTKGRRVTKTGSSDVSIPVKSKQSRATRSKTTDVPCLSGTTDTDQPVKTALPTKGRRVTKTRSNDVSIPVKCKQLRATRSKTTDVPCLSGTTDDGQCMTACESMNCLNEDEKYWVECTTCSSWYHCSCVNVLWEEVREESYNFFCFKCSLI